MKKILTLILAAGFLLACNSKNEKSTTAEPVVKNHEHAEKASGLVLNNGAKWKADSSTFVNVVLLKSIVSGAGQESLENYMQKATQLTDGLSKMVRECKMKGADHDALHHWLEPLMQKVKDLNKATTTESAAAGMSEIDKQLNLFAQYFEK